LIQAASIRNTPSAQYQPITLRINSKGSLTVRIGMITTSGKAAIANGAGDHPFIAEAWLG
jgi:hypothetical protein